MRLLLIAVLAALVANCSMDKFVERFLTPEEKTLLRSAVDDVARSDVADLSKKVSPELASEVAGAMPNMHAALPPAPFDLAARSANFNSSNGTRDMQVVYEATGKGVHAVVYLTMHTAGGHTTITAMRVERTGS
jgi:hypothetical protein